jgi:DNA-binding CsgD family transcriptional regulator
VPKKTSPADVLSPRERAVVLGIAEGKTYQEIAESLGVGYETVKTYAARLRKKLGLNSKTSVAVWAVRNKLTD